MPDVSVTQDEDGYRVNVNWEAPERPYGSRGDRIYLLDWDEITDSEFEIVYGYNPFQEDGRAILASESRVSEGTDIERLKSDLNSFTSDVRVQEVRFLPEFDELYEDAYRRKVDVTGSDYSALTVEPDRIELKTRTYGDDTTTRRHYFFARDGDTAVFTGEREPIHSNDHDGTPLSLRLPDSARQVVEAEGFTVDTDTGREDYLTAWEHEVAATDTDAIKDHGTIRELLDDRHPNPAIDLFTH